MIKEVVKEGHRRLDAEAEEEKVAREVELLLQVEVGLQEKVDQTMDVLLRHLHHLLTILLLLQQILRLITLHQQQHQKVVTPLPQLRLLVLQTPVQLQALAQSQQVQLLLLLHQRLQVQPVPHHQALLVPAQHQHHQEEVEDCSLNLMPNQELT